MWAPSQALKVILMVTSVIKYSWYFLLMTWQWSVVVSPFPGTDGDDETIEEKQIKPQCQVSNWYVKKFKNSVQSTEERYNQPISRNKI